jgi:hypothetical protein
VLRAQSRQATISAGHTTTEMSVDTCRAFHVEHLKPLPYVDWFDAYDEHLRAAKAANPTLSSQDAADLASIRAVASDRSQSAARDKATLDAAATLLGPPPEAEAVDAAADRLARAAATRDAPRDDEAYVIYNGCYGGLSFSDRFYDELTARTCVPRHHWNSTRGTGDGASAAEGAPLSERTHPTAVAVLRDLGTRVCSGKHARLCLTTVRPAAALAYCVIKEYDGSEWVRFDKGAAIEASARVAVAGSTDGTAEARLGALRAAIATWDGVKLVLGDV